MSELLGLLDALEAVILDSKKIPLTDNIVINEYKLIDIIDKARLVIKTKGDILKEKYQLRQESSPEVNLQSSKVTKSDIDLEMEKIKKIKQGAQEYASFVLSNLQLTVTKMQNNLIKLEKNIESGRDIIEKKNESLDSKEKNIEMEKIHE
jgi:hypothetical protein